jgi:rod shape-determining protein MreD
LSISFRGFLLVTLANFVAQYLLYRHLRLFHLSPDLVLLQVVFVNRAFSGVGGLVFGCLAGFFQDFLLRATPGGHGIAYLTIAYLAGRLPGAGRREGHLAVFTVCAFLSFLYAMVDHLLRFYQWSGFVSWQAFSFSAGNAIFALPAFHFYRRFMQREPG